MPEDFNKGPARSYSYSVLKAFREDPHRAEHRQASSQKRAPLYLPSITDEMLTRTEGLSVLRGTAPGRRH